MLHGHQGGILGEGFAEHGAALHIGADHLVRPPLVAQFVGGDIGDHVDLGVIAGVDDEADAFGIGDGVGEGLGEIGVVRELQDARLAELIGAEVGLVVVEPELQRRDHAIDVPRVVGVVIDGEVDALIEFMAHGVLGRLHREEHVDRRFGAKLADMATVGDTVGHPIARRDRRLVCDRGDRDIRGDPVGVLTQVVELARGLILQLG